MKNFFLYVFLLVGLSSTVIGQKNISLVGQLEFPGDRMTDIWGYVDSSGHEYAIMGRANGTSIIDITTDPSNPTELFFIPGANSGWRDMKTWKNYGYVTNESSGGLLIIDFQYLPDSIQFHNWSSSGFNTAHNIFIDEKGYAYLLGYNSSGGALFVDLNNDPYNPTLVGSYTTRYIHDAYIRNDTMWSAEINDGIFSVVDVSNKSNPVVITSAATPGNFTHNLWLSDDGNYLYTTDELSNAYIASYDVSDLGNITELDRYQSSPGQNVIPHNTFVKGDFLLTSYYRDGVVINDVTYPDNIVEIGNYDTSPFSGDGFNGCWGVYPYLPSGLILASDMENGLFVLQPNYVQASYISGNVTDQSSGLSLSNAQIEILTSSITDVTDISGNYKMGTPDAGTYDILFSKVGYKDSLVTGVSLTAGVITVIDVALKPKQSFTLALQIVDEQTQSPVPNGQVTLLNNQISYVQTADASGMVSIPGFFDGTYDVFAGKWGYITQFISGEEILFNNGLITVEIPEGWYDDFTFDFSWTATGVTAAGGSWVRVEPTGTTFPGSPLINPDFDVQDDLSDKCYVTGNSELFDFVNGGTVVLESPEFDLTGNVDPYINYSVWFLNLSNFGIGNDTLVTSIFDGSVWHTVERFDQLMDTTSISTWQDRSIRVLDYATPGSQMKIKFVAIAPDANFTEVTEVGIDHFRVIDSSAVSAVQVIENRPVSVQLYPNPAQNQVTVSIDNISGSYIQLELFDILGSKLFSSTLQTRTGKNNEVIDISDLIPGVYFVKVSSDKYKEVKKLIINR